MSAFLLAATTVIGAQDFNDVSSTAKQDLEKALKDLAAVQKQISEEKIPLSRKMNMAEEAVLAKRKELDNREREQANQMVDLGVLKNQVKGRSEQVGYLSGLFNEFSQAVESRLHEAEFSRYEETLQAGRAAAEDKSLAPAEALERQAATLGLAIDRIDALLGGEVFEGQAVAGGAVEQGKFAVFGPVAVFSANTTDVAGTAKRNLNSKELSVTVPPAEMAGGIKGITESNIGALPVDTTMGDADKIAATEETLYEHAAKGGPTMIPLLGLGVLAVLIGVFKYFQIGFIRLARPRDIQIIVDRVNERNNGKAIEHASRIRGPVGDMLKVAIEHSNEKKEYIEEVLYEKMLKVRPRLEAYLPVVAIAAATAPLLGLLGTVTGMINTFKVISVFGTGDPKTLSGGISEALVTTEFGLIVAIPALLIHAVISRKAKGVMGAMEQISVAFINGVDPTICDEEEPAAPTPPNTPAATPEPPPEANAEGDDEALPDPQPA
ncbi:MAG: MotA/TolQ/ExbB proton channel family protein [Limisphaerales bacterium]